MSRAHAIFICNSTRGFCGSAIKGRWVQMVWVKWDFRLSQTWRIDYLKLLNPKLDIRSSFPTIMVLISLILFTKINIILSINVLYYFYGWILSLERCFYKFSFSLSFSIYLVLWSSSSSYIWYKLQPTLKCLVLQHSAVVRYFKFVFGLDLL